jgi:adenine nucleotide transporter 17
MFSIHSQHLTLLNSHVLLEVLVANPVIQYTVFEQLKNLLVKRRTDKLRAAGQAAQAILSDWDYFVLGAISKLC